MTVLLDQFQHLQNSCKVTLCIRVDVVVDVQGIVVGGH